MANVNLSDMFGRKILQNALRSIAGTTSSSHLPRSSLTMAEIAQLSTFDKPAAPTLEENAYYDKYKAKLEKIKQSRPDEYKAAIDQVYGGRKETPRVKTDDVKGSAMLSQMQSSSQSQEKTSKTPNPKQRKDLDSIVKLDLLQDKSASEISQIWSQYFMNKEGALFATIPVDKYNRLKEKGNELPLFVYPVPREAGYEFMLGQCSQDDWYYTQLLAYQTHGEYAPYGLAIHYYTELAQSKGIVLMVGEIAAKELSPELATLLVHQTQLMYGSDDNLTLVRLMHEKPDEFQHMAVIDVCKKAGIF